MLLINTSLKNDSNTGHVISGLLPHLEKRAIETTLAKLCRFPIFTGDYITGFDGLRAVQAQLLQELETAQDHLYFVPTYYKAMPGGFKNYLDAVKRPKIYQRKRIGIISTNAKNQDYGARQFMQSLLGLLEFHQAVSIVVPQILILSPTKIEFEALDHYLDYFFSFPKP